MLWRWKVDSREFRRAEAKVSGEGNRVQPELCRLIVAIHMDMGRFVRLVAVKIPAARSHRQDGWHAFQYLTVVGRVRAGRGGALWWAGRKGS